MPGLHHVGYWVDDLDSALTRWGQDLGVGPFQVIEHVAFEEFVLTVGGRRHDDVVFDHSAAFAAWGPVVVELGQVHAIDDRLAAAYGVAPAAYGAASGAVSHVSWVMPDLTRESARLARLGCPADQHGTVGPDLGRLARRGRAVSPPGGPRRAAPHSRPVPGPADRGPHPAEHVPLGRGPPG